ncbi:10967_t:CDS:2, partial [Diversispora eburnea]
IRCSVSPSETSLPQDDTSKQMSKNASDTDSNSGVCQKSKTRKSLEGEEIIQAIKEKKLRDQDLSSINQDQTRKDTYISNQESPPIVQVRKAEFHSSEVKIPYNQKIEQGIIQEVILFIQKEKILTSLTNTPKTQDSDIEVSEDKNGRELARLFSDAEIAEGKTIKAKQKEIICWCTYRKSYQNTVAEIRTKTGVSEKTAKKVKGIGIDKVYGISYGTRSISELTDTQILNIINRIASIVTKNKENGHDQNYVTTETKKTLSEAE